MVGLKIAICAFLIGIAIAGAFVTTSLLKTAWEYFVENTGYVSEALRPAVIVGTVTIVSLLIANSLWNMSLFLSIIGFIILCSYAKEK